jgi:MYXO-CTERM domain-containing protein
MTPATGSAKKDQAVTRADIEAKLQQIKHVTDATTDTAADAGKGAMIGGAVLVVVLAYWFGRRRGHKKNTIVEIRRI